MKKILLTTLSVLIFASCTNLSSNPTQKLSIEQDIANGHSQGFYNMEGKRTGKWDGIYNNGIVAYEANYVDGVPVDKFIAYYENGKAKERGQYAPTNSGKRIGNWIEYYPNGGIKKLSRYNDEFEESVSITTYDQNGKVVETKLVTPNKTTGFNYSYNQHGKFIGRDPFTM